MTENDKAFRLKTSATARNIDATKYLRRLCKHFSHKVAAKWDDSVGHVTFAMGECSLQADGDALHMTCSANEQSALDDIVETVDSHLVRFAHDSEVNLQWRAAAE